MSAELYTSITAKGTKEELQSILNVLKTFETENYERYCTDRSCAYIEDVYVNGTDLGDFFDEDGEICVEDEDGEICIEDEDGEMNIEASGPYGHFYTLGEVGLFEAIADAAPGVSFQGNSGGFITGADVSIDAEIQDGKLHLSEYYATEEMLMDEYKKAVLGKLPYEQFHRIFKLAEDEFDENSYLDFIQGAMADFGLPNMDYEQFKKYWDSSFLEEEEYNQAIEQIQCLGLTDFIIFKENCDKDKYTKKSVYDPIAKQHNID